MNNPGIYRKRIQQVIDTIHAQRYTDIVPLEASFIYDQAAPIPYEKARNAKFESISVGQKWGEQWGSAWFRFEGTVAASQAGREVVALIDIDGEACVYEDGVPHRGLTHKKTEEGAHVKRRVPVGNPAKKGKKISLLVEGAASGLFGREADHAEQYLLRQAELAVLDRGKWQLALDMHVLVELAEALPEDSPRARKILQGLNEIANLWRNGGPDRVEACAKITRSLLAKKANASDCTVWSVGHAHIDLGWLWPVRETKRKGARTFATALRLIEEYPGYRFGASQPQLYAWIKQDHPKLYKQIKDAVKAGSWELQGAMWVEPDMNITGGESLVRQCLYGKRFYEEEFGKDVRNLWLPDVFGYSAALPQILKKSGVDVFMTQKMSWNETNVFPHHTFHWEGIDGTRILTHFLPTNTYNLQNRPKQLIDAQKRFAQADVQDDFLNLFGIGDGGGGPSRYHIERALRLAGTEGSPKVKMAFAEEFFKRIARTPAEKLPLWAGELYLELHRGTLTTQGRMKKYNRQLEHKLRDAELLSVLARRDCRGFSYPKALLDEVWKDTLLNQFHDILPGSSITWVYRDAHALSEQNLQRIAQARSQAFEALFNAKSKASPANETYVVFNSLSWPRTEVVELPVSGKADVSAFDAEGNPLPAARLTGALLVKLVVPSMGYTSFTVSKGSPAEPEQGAVTCTENALENNLVRVRLADDGSISSIYDKKAHREAVENRANRLLLWEDLPYNWDAWDVSHYYRETKPEQAQLVEREILEDSALRCAIRQKLSIGLSTIEQVISLSSGSKTVSIANTVDWKESKKILRVHAETSVLARTARFEIQYGVVERTTHQNTSWDQAQFEVSGQRFADLSADDFGIALINDSKYGYSVFENSIELSLLRSPKSPDPEADISVHSFTYGYYTHKGPLTGSGTLEAAHELNTPAIVNPVSSLPEQPTHSFFSIKGSNVKIDAVKEAESGDGIVLRLYETAGTSPRVRLESDREWQSVVETDMLEKPLRRPSGAGSSVRLTFTPFEIKTLLIR